MLLAIIFTVAHVRHTNPFIIWDRGFHILSYLISAHINCVQTLPGWFTMQRGLLCSAPTAGNKWFLSPCTYYLLTGTPSVTKCKHLHVLYHMLNFKKKKKKKMSHWRGLVHWKKTCFWCTEGQREQGQADPSESAPLPDLEDVASLSGWNKKIVLWWDTQNAVPYSYSCRNLKTFSVGHNVIIL